MRAGMLVVAAAVVVLSAWSGAEGAEQLGAESKEWVPIEDDRTRIDHSDAVNQIVPIKSPFLVGGAELMFPGDPSGPPEQVINCRCAAAYS